MSYYCQNMLLSKLPKNILRYFSTISSRNITEKLTARSLICIKGSDSTSLLQGLVTNDVSQLDNCIGCLYTLFLNNKGRILYDSIIYKLPEDCYYLEVDQSVIQNVTTHLNMYRLRKKVNIEILKSHHIFVNFNPEIITQDPRKSLDSTEEKVIPCMSLKMSDNAVIKETKHGNVYEYTDPRITCLGTRIIADNDKAIEEIYNYELTSKYKLLRYRLGVPEGTTELPIGTSFPLEANCDLMHGISFQKGCYLGQELTARTYHTGVIRKRYMPIYFEKDCKFDNEEIVRIGDQNVGKLRGVEKNFGLGLLRIAQVDDKTLRIGSESGYTVKPFWWPNDKIKNNCKAVQM